MNETISKNKITFFNEEIEKINIYLSDFTSRTNLLFTIAGLLSFLPSLVVNPEIYLVYFLQWTLPFLLIALVTYIPASLRVQSVIKGAQISSKENEIINYSYNLKRLEIIWRESVGNYDRVLLWSRITHGIIYLYITSLSLNLYAFIFYGEPQLSTKIWLLLISGIFSITLFVLPILLSKKGVEIGETD